MSNHLSPNTRNNRVLFFLILIAGLGLLFFTACPIPSDTGSLKITLTDARPKLPQEDPKDLIAGSTASQTIYSDGYGNPIAYYTLTLTSPGGTSTTVTLPDGDDSYLADNLLPGAWTITAIAYDANDDYRGEGTSSVTVKSTTETTNTTIAIDFAGTCDISLEISWPDLAYANLSLVGTIYKDYDFFTFDPEQPNSTEISFSPNANSATANLEDFDAGHHYLNIQLLDGDTVLWAKYAMLYLDKDSVTTISETLVEDDLHLLSMSISITNNLPDFKRFTLVTTYGDSGPVCTVKAIQNSNYLDLAAGASAVSWLVNGQLQPAYTNSNFPLTALSSYGKYDITAFIKYQDNTYIAGRRIELSRNQKVAALSSSSTAFNTFALGTDGSLVSWGTDNPDTPGFLLHENPGSTLSPEAVTATDLQGAEAIEIGHYFGIARKAGELWSWGLNNYGYLGNGTTITSNTPGQVVLPEGYEAESFSVGSYHILAILKDTATDDTVLYGWGKDTNLQLAGVTGEGNDFTKTPLQISGVPSPTAVAAGEAHSIALDSAGKIWTWGNNMYGQLGNGSQGPFEVAIPTQIDVNGDSSLVFTQIAANMNMSYAITNTGVLYGWGLNGANDASIGITDISAQYSPVVIATNVAKIAVGRNFAVILKRDNSVWAWGSNVMGQVGNGTFASPVLEPVSIFHDEPVFDIWAESFTGAFETSSGLYVWGRNDTVSSLGLGYYSFPLTYYASPSNSYRVVAEHTPTLLF